MPKYNLMDNKEPDSLDQQFDQEIKKTEKVEKQDREDQPLQIEQFEQPDSDSHISEEIFDSAAISAVEEEMESAPPEINIPQSDEESEPPSPPSEHKTPAFVQSDLNSVDLESEYDYKQPGLNYKPVLYVVGIIIAAVAIYFGVSTIFFSDDATDEVETVAETPEQRMQRERDEQKQRFLSSVNSTNESRLGQVITLIDIRPSNITYSSILLYGDALTLEVFARNRDNLATFNLSLKNNPIITRYNIETVDTRPGKNGGLFAVYDVQTREGSAGSSSPVDSIKFAALSPTDWAKNVSLKLKSQRQISTAKENLFSKSRQEYIFNGSEQKCHNLIKQMLSSRANYRIHKLSLIPSNQTNMSASAYEMKLIVDFYL